MCVVKWVCYGLIAMYVGIVGVGVFLFYLLSSMIEQEEDDEDEKET